MADNSAKAIVLILGYGLVSYLVISAAFNIYWGFGALALCASVSLFDPVIGLFYD